MFKVFVAKEAKLVAFLETNQKTCGVPPKIITQVKANHAKSVQIRNNVCSTAPAGPAAGPSLSDALGGPIIADDSSAKLPGRGTFDTLTGNALQKRSSLPDASPMRPETGWIPSRRNGRVPTSG
jgi:hypothetical protein